MNLLKLLWRRWLIIARIVGNFQSQVILSLFYLTVLSPVGFLLRLFSDPLRLRSGQALMIKKRNASSNFQKWEHEKDNLKNARKQF